MKPDIEKMHKVWSGIVRDQRGRTQLSSFSFDDIVSSIFGTGPFYYYIIDFYDMHISNISAGFVEAHGIVPERIENINDILSLIHPDDMEFVSMAEKKAIKFFYGQLSMEQVTRYKASYNFRFRTADGSYRLYNHQSLILTTDEKGNFIKSLNIHTDISHITEKNNHKLSFIGLSGEPSYLNLDVFEKDKAKAEPAPEHRFTKRETEIIKLLSEGASSKKISDELYISLETVKSHRKNILTKSGCKNVAELVARSLSEGWI